jgi:putative tricarboxylic transport membrane protein
MNLDGGRAIGAAAVVVGLLAIVFSLRLDEDTLTGGPGAWLLPALLGAVVALIGGTIALRRTPAVRRDVPLDRGARVRVGGTLGAVLLYAVAFERLGFLLSTTAFVAALLVFYGERRWPVIAAVAVVGAGATYAVFARWLGVPLP